jgi:hypothetical protein
VKEWGQGDRERGKREKGREKLTERARESGRGGERESEIRETEHDRLGVRKRVLGRDLNSLYSRLPLH